MKASIEFAKAEYITKRTILKNKKILECSNYIKDIIGTFKEYGIRVTDESIEGFKSAVLEILSSEQTFNSIRSFDYWENMNASNYNKNIPEKIFE